MIHIYSPETHICQENQSLIAMQMSSKHLVSENFTAYGTILRAEIIYKICPAPMNHFRNEAQLISPRLRIFYDLFSIFKQRWWKYYGPKVNNACKFWVFCSWLFVIIDGFRTEMSPHWWHWNTIFAGIFCMYDNENLKLWCCKPYKCVTWKAHKLNFPTFFSRICWLRSNWRLRGNIMAKIISRP